MLHGSWQHLPANLTSQVHSMGANLLAQVKSNAKLNPAQLQQMALSQLKSKFPKANVEQLHHAATMAIHHATDLLHGHFDGLFGQAKGAAAQAAAKATQIEHDMLHRAHDVLAKGVQGMMSNFKPGNVAKIFKGFHF